MFTPYTERYSIKWSILDSIKRIFCVGVTAIIPIPDDDKNTRRDTHSAHLEAVYKFKVRGWYGDNIIKISDARPVLSGKGNGHMNDCRVYETYIPMWRYYWRYGSY